MDVSLFSSLWWVKNVQKLGNCDSNQHSFGIFFQNRLRNNSDRLFSNTAQIYVNLLNRSLSVNKLD